MSDIVDRLYWVSAHPVTGELQLTNPDGPAAASENDWLRFEIERLRAALTEIAGGKHYADDPWSIALAALSPAKDKPI